MSKAFEDEEMLEILESYLIESSEILEILTSSLIELEKEPEDSELINKIFRYFHTIKGTSSFMGFDDIAKLTHSAEDLLNKTRRGELKVSQDIIDALMDSRDRLDDMVAAITNPNGDIPYQDLVVRINALSNGETIVEEEATTNMDSTSDGDSVVSKIAANKEMFQGSGDFNSEELDLLEKAFAEINSSFKSNDTNDKSTDSALIQPDNENDKTESQEIKSEIVTEDFYDKSSDDKNVALESSAEKTVQNKPTLGKGVTQTETIRIDVKRVESLMDLSGELVLGRNRLAQITNKAVLSGDLKSILSELVETTNQMDLITSEIQTSVMKMRMVPIGRLFQKAPKIVRDLSKEFGKKINLQLEGEDTEVDRGIIEELNDPLVHMLRNSCDHGIESAEERLQSGKNPIGQIKLVAYHEGNHIIIKIIDDGKGIDPNVIIQKGIEKGFISQEQSKHLSDWEIFQLIFKPGFSTAKQVTAVSGRGVGMDVVKTNINKLKGIIEIDSKAGKGSEFTVKLPLTLAIIQGLLVKSSGNTYALPLSSVVEVVSLDEENVSYINSGRVIRIRNEVLPLITLDQVTGDPDKKKTNTQYVVNIAVGIDRVGLVVDELLGQQEIVIKSLGNYLVNIEGIAGSTIIGDGSVIMILDTQGIIKKFRELKN